MTPAHPRCAITALLVVAVAVSACSGGTSGERSAAPPSPTVASATSASTSAAPTTTPASTPDPKPTVALAHLAYRAGIAVPDPHVTPGSILPGVTSVQICTAEWNADHKTIPFGVQNKVSERYGVIAGNGTRIHLDQLVPATLGGDATARNVWPEPSDGRNPGFETKNALESTLRRLVCHGELDLATAQRAIRTDWPSALREYPPDS